jgi:multiple sugar transport system ATP-binding protein
MIDTSDHPPSLASTAPAEPVGTHVAFSGIYKLFGSIAAVRNLDLEIKQGEFLVLVGPSGCGKTTTLRMLAGLERPTYGSITIGGKDVTRVASRDRNIALVFQSYALYPHMTVRENLAFGMKARHEPRRRIRTRVQEVAETLDITVLLERRPAALSGGQRQRVALGRALIREPEVFLMDEPLSNLDAALRVQMRAELARLHERLGITTVYVTHDQVEAMTMGDRIALMRDGVLQQIDAPEALYSHPANLFVAGFIGSPRMNLVRASRAPIDGGHAVECLGVSVPLSRRSSLLDGGRDVILGLRPEDLRWGRGAMVDGHVTLRAQVEVVEPLGSETLISVAVGDQRLIARFPPRTGISPGESVDLAFDPAHVHMFDPGSGASVLRHEA